MNKPQASETTPAVNGWDDTPSYRRNKFQKIAAKTNGWLTPGNLVTVSGNAVAAAGIEQVATGNYVRGAAMFFLGKAGGDKLDGTVARATKTTTPLGEALDVGFDKLLTVGALTTMMATGLYPAEASVPKLATQFAIVGAGLKANSKRGKEMGITLHPGLAGKLNMGVTYASISSFMAANSTELKSHNALNDVVTYGGGYGLTAASVALGTYAAVSYVRQTREQSAAYDAAQIQQGPAPEQQASA